MASVTSTAAWFVVHRTMGQGPALTTRTTELSMWGKIFVPTVLVQGLTTTGLSLSLAVVSTDCLASIVLAIFTLAILFASYFAIEAVRTENVYQLFAYMAASSTGMLGIVLCATENDIPGFDMRRTFTSFTTEGALLRTALVSAAALQLCVPTRPRRASRACPAPFLRLHPTGPGAAVACAQDRLPARAADVLRHGRAPRLRHAHVQEGGHRPRADRPVPAVPAVLLVPQARPALPAVARDGVRARLRHVLVAVVAHVAPPRADRARMAAARARRR